MPKCDHHVATAMQVHEIMSSPVVTVPPDDTLHEAVGTMLEHSVGSAIVVSDALEGIITRSDALRVAYYERAPLTDLPVAAGMSSDLVTIDASKAVRTALRTMETHDIKKLPVVRDFDLVGIITMSDIARHKPEEAQEIQQQIERRDEWT